MTDEVLRNGLPHKVTTSLVTHNAVLPQNIFMREEVPALRDSDMDGVTPFLETPDPASALEQTTSTPAPQAAPTYPVTTDKLETNDALTTIKSHIRDNIQALKNLAHSDNWQGIAADQFNQNLQSLGASRSIEEIKLFLEKKSMQSNRQVIAPTTTARPAPHLATPTATPPSSLNSEGLKTQATELKNAETSRQDDHPHDVENAFQLRVKKLKSHVSNVESTLQNLDPDK